MKKIRIAMLAVPAATLLLSGCFGYGGMYGGYQNRVPKTTAAADSLDTFDYGLLASADDRFEYEGLPWGSSVEDMEKCFSVSSRQMQSFSNGGGYGDINYSIKTEGCVSVGLMPVYDEKSGLRMLSFYFEETYTAEQLDKLYDDIVASCGKLYGEPAEVKEEEQESNRIKFKTETTFWYRQVSEDMMTSLQIAKSDSGTGTSVVIIGINEYDPAELESEAETEPGASSGGTQEET